MEYISQYIIPLEGLDEEEYTYQMKADDAFFRTFEKSEIKGGDVDVQIVLLKKKDTLLLNLDLSGSVKITCDRCLEIYDQPISISDEILVNYGEETNFDTDSDSVTLSRDANSIDVSEFIYEYSHFALPLAHYHPNDSDGNPTCDKKMLELIEKYKVEEVLEESENEDAMDPRWEALREIKNNSK